MRKAWRRLAALCLIVSASCLTEPPSKPKLPPDPVMPSPPQAFLGDEAAALIDSSPELFEYVAGVGREALAWKIYALRFKMWRADARLIVGEIDQDERDAIVLPILEGLREMGEE